MIKDKMLEKILTKKYLLTVPNHGFMEVVNHVRQQVGALIYVEDIEKAPASWPGNISLVIHTVPDSEAELALKLTFGSKLKDYA